MTPNLLDELEKIVALSDAASFNDLDWGWRRDDDDAPGSIFTNSFGGAHQAVAMCPRYGRDNFAADAAYLTSLHNWFRTHAPALADMAKRLEAAERDARRYRWLREQNANLDNPDAWTITRCDFTDEEGPARYWVGSDLDAAIAATQEGEG